MVLTEECKIIALSPGEITGSFVILLFARLLHGAYIIFSRYRQVKKIENLDNYR